MEVIEYSRDRTIAGVSQTYPMPAVVRVLRRFKRDRIRIKFSRLNIRPRRVRVPVRRQATTSSSLA